MWEKASFEKKSSKFFNHKLIHVNFLFVPFSPLNSCPINSTSHLLIYKINEYISEKYHLTEQIYNNTVHDYIIVNLNKLRISLRPPLLVHIINDIRMVSPIHLFFLNPGF